MAKARLNDTKALTAEASDGASHSISTEKIDNGFLVRQSSCDPRTGEYKSTTVFQATPPRLIPGRAARQGASPDSGNSLRQTMDYLKDR